MLDEISKLVDVGGFQKLQYLQQKDSVFELRTQLNELDEQTNMLTISFNQIKIEYQKEKTNCKSTQRCRGKASVSKSPSPNLRCSLR